jgi:hypothetical protein
MAKYQKRSDHSGRGIEITTPSRYGSHSSMVVEELEEGRVVCKDDAGEYTTLKSRLDTGLSDPNRYSTNR